MKSQLSGLRPWLRLNSLYLVRNNFRDPTSRGDQPCVVVQGARSAREAHAYIRRLDRDWRRLFYVGRKHFPLTWKYMQHIRSTIDKHREEDR